MDSIDYKLIFITLVFFVVVNLLSGCVQDAHASSVGDTSPIQVSQYNQLVADANKVGVTDGFGVLNYVDINVIGGGSAGSFVDTNTQTAGWTDENGVWGIDINGGSFFMKSSAAYCDGIPIGNSCAGRPFMSCVMEAPICAWDGANCTPSCSQFLYPETDCKNTEGCVWHPEVIASGFVDGNITSNGHICDSVGCINAASVVWGAITGTLSDQNDLWSYLQDLNSNNIWYLDTNNIAHLSHGTGASIGGSSTIEYCQDTPNNGDQCSSYFGDETSCNAFSNHYGECGAWNVDQTCQGDQGSYCYYNFGDSGSCNSQNGCGWIPYNLCQGDMYTYCSTWNADDTTCNTTNGCAYDYGSSSCYETAECYSQDASTCGDYGGCYLADYGNCSNTIDCTSQTYGDCPNYGGCYQQDNSYCPTASALTCGGQGVDAAACSVIGGCNFRSSPIYSFMEADYFKSNIPDGLPPMQIVSTTTVPNLSANYLEGQNVAALDGRYYSTSNPSGYLTSAVTSVSGTTPISVTAGNTPTVSLSWNATNLRNSGGLNTIQNIATTSTPTFAGGSITNTVATGQSIWNMNYNDATTIIPAITLKRGVNPSTGGISIPFFIMSGDGTSRKAVELIATSENSAGNNMAGHFKITTNNNAGGTSYLDFSSTGGLGINAPAFTGLQGIQIPQSIFFGTSNNAKLSSDGSTELDFNSGSYGQLFRFDGINGNGIKQNVSVTGTYEKATQTKLEPNNEYKLTSQQYTLGSATPFSVTPNNGGAALTTPIDLQVTNSVMSWWQYGQGNTNQYVMSGTNSLIRWNNTTDLVVWVGTAAVTFTVTAPAAQWNNFIVKKNGSVYTLWMNGASGVVQACSDFTTHWQVGVIGGNLINQYPMATKIDEFALWGTGTTFTDATALSLWNSGRGTYINSSFTPAPLAAWHFDDTNATVAVDSIGGNTATFGAAPTQTIQTINNTYGLATYNVIDVNNTVTKPTTTFGDSRMQTNIDGNVEILKNITFDGNTIFTKNVGIGTTSPATALDIIGVTRITNVDTNATEKAAKIVGRHYLNNEEDVMLLYSDSALGQNYVNFGGGSAAQNSATILKFFTSANQNTVNGIERMRIDESGNVGIGTITPTNILDVNSKFVVNGTTGNVGVGTTVPAAKLQVDKTNVSNIPAFVISGVGNYSGSPTDDVNGVGIGLVYNAPSNRQFWIGDSVNGTGIRISGSEISGWTYGGSDRTLSIGANGQDLLLNGASTLKGKVGVGMNNPSQLFDVNSKFVVNGVTGNVGIGTIAPQNKLNIIGDINATGALSAAGGSLNHATCWKANGVIGYCSTALDVNGICTCN